VDRLFAGDLGDASAVIPTMRLVKIGVVLTTGAPPDPPKVQRTFDSGALRGRDREPVPIWPAPLI